MDWRGSTADGAGACAGATAGAGRRCTRTSTSANRLGATAARFHDFSVAAAAAAAAAAPHIWRHLSRATAACSAKKLGMQRARELGAVVGVGQ